jgi:hypothetical protein
VISHHFFETEPLINQAPKGKAKRDIEDAVVQTLVRNIHQIFQQTLDLIMDAEWYVLSARRADKLLRELLLIVYLRFECEASHAFSDVPSSTCTSLFLRI